MLVSIESHLAYHLTFFFHTTLLLPEVCQIGDSDV